MGVCEGSANTFCISRDYDKYHSQHSILRGLKRILVRNKISSLRDARGHANDTGWLTVHFSFDRKIGLTIE